MTAPPTELPVLGGDTLAEHLPSLLGLATALTGQAETATDLVALSLTRRPALVRRALTADFPEPRLRSLLVQQFLTRRTKPAGTGLAALTARQRAAVVLRDGLQLTALETAATMDRPASSVIADLDALPESYATEIAALTAMAPAPGTVLTRLDRATRTNRRRRVRAVILVAAIAIVVAVLVAVPTVILPRLPAPSRTAGEWRFSHEIRPAAGWSVMLRSITRTGETTEIKPPVQPGDPYSCWANVYVAGAYAAEDQVITERTTVHGRSAFFGLSEDDDGYLAWEYGDNAWAKVYCSTLEPNSEVLRTIADMVTFRPSEVRMPFRLASLPANYTLRGITEYPDSHLVEAQLARSNLRPGDVNIVVSGPLDRFGGRGGDPETIAGRRWLYTPGTDQRMCTSDPGGLSLCVSGFWPGGEWPAPAPYPRNAPQQLRSVVDQLTPVADLTDVAQWPTASDLPRG